MHQGIIGVERSFTGQQKDFGTGLIYFKARYYDPELGTFISPDTLVPDATNLFAYNRYMYVIGNPLRYNDPTGHDFWDVIDTAVDFAQGVGAQVGYNNTVVALPSAINAYAPQAGESTSMQVGRLVGSVVTAVQGGAEMVAGVTLGTGGSAACATGVGCLAGAPTVVGGTMVAAHGGTVATASAIEAGAQLGNIMMAIMGGGIGRQIADGHVSADHLDAFADVGINDVDELADLIDGIVESPDLTKTGLRNGREAYWLFDEGDDFFGTLVIKDPRNPDGGTVFRPDNGIDYFDNLR